MSSISHQHSQQTISQYMYPQGSYYQPNKILLDDSDLLNSTWTEIYCSSGHICGYITRVALSAGNCTLLHVDSDARIGVSVYGFRRYNSYGYPGGLKLIECECIICDCYNNYDRINI